MSKQKNVKYIFVFGGVLSGLGKGIVSASLGYLLKSKGFKKQKTPLHLKCITYDESGVA